MKKVLFICPYIGIYPPVNGGMLRCFHLIDQAGSYFDLTVLMGQDPASFRECESDYPAIKNIKIIQSGSWDEPKDIFRIFPERIKKSLRYRWYIKFGFRGTDSICLQYYFSLRKLLSVERFDAVVICNISLLGLSKLIRHRDSQTAIIYDAHNVDYSLAVEFYKKGLISNSSAKRLLSAESSIARCVDAITACSQQDLEQLMKLNKSRFSGQVVPNAVVDSSISYSDSVMHENPERILFYGSLDYEPNREGLKWFLLSVWPIVREDIPDLKVIIAGSGNPGSELKDLLHNTGVEFVGFQKKITDQYKRAAIAIVPLITGSGTRLKILEAMSFGVPVVSTTKGAEGISCTHELDILLADDSRAFALEIIRLIKDMNMRIKLSNNAKKIVHSRYNWKISGRVFCEFTENQINQKIHYSI